MLIKLSILDLILFSIIFFLPAYIANAMPVIASGFNLMPFLAKPINEKIFGKSKTYRGFIFGILGALVVGLIQFYFKFYNGFTHNDAFIFTMLTSFLLGFGALLGDLGKSYFKRLIGKKSGESWVIIDQIDYAVGALLLLSLFFVPDLKIIITLLVISPLLSLIANIIAYKFKLKKVWW